jgi:hypothetical protein
LRRIQIGQQRLDTHHGACLLPGRHDQRRMGVPRIGERTHAVAGAGGGVEINEGWLPSRLGVPVSHAHYNALVQAEEIAEVCRKILQERQLV